MNKLKLIWAVLRGEKLYKESEELERYLDCADKCCIYTMDDLVSFGNYLLSDKRKDTLVSDEASKYVGDWDISNWENR